MNPDTQLIYIVGSGHSGSTILSFILGSSPQIVNGGELKFYNNHYKGEGSNLMYMKNECSCGAAALECPFWKEVDKRLEGPVSVYHYTDRSRLIQLMTKLLGNPKGFIRKARIKDEQLLLDAIVETSSEEGPRPSYVLDASKTLSRLIHLYEYTEIPMKVIFLVRDGRGFVNSYRKIEGGVWRWAFQWVIENTLTERFLTNTSIDYLHVSYDQLCKSPREQIERISSWLGIESLDDYIGAVRNTEFHVRAGNPIKNNISEFDGLHHDTKYTTELTSSEQSVLTKLLSSYNDRWNK